MAKHYPVGKQVDRNGVLAVEMALTLPLLFLILFGIFELSSANMIRQATQAAAYESARVAIVPGSNAQEAKAAAKVILDSVGVTTFDFQMSPSVLDAQTTKVNISIQVPLDQNLVAARFVAGVKFKGECELSRELVSSLQQ